MLTIIVIICFLLFILLVIQAILWQRPKIHYRHRTLWVPLKDEFEHCFDTKEISISNSEEKKYPATIRSRNNQTCVAIHSLRSPQFNGHITVNVDEELYDIYVDSWDAKDHSYPIKELFLSYKHPEISDIADKYNIKITYNQTKDIWLRDEFFIGYVNEDPFILNGPRDRELDQWIATLSNKRGNYKCLI